MTTRSAATEVLFKIFNSGSNVRFSNNGPPILHTSNFTNSSPNMEHTQHIAPAPGPGMLSVMSRCDDKQAQFIGSLTWPTNKPNNK